MEIGVDKTFAHPVVHLGITPSALLLHTSGGDQRASEDCFLTREVDFSLTSMDPRVGSDAPPLSTSEAYALLGVTIEGCTLIRQAAWALSRRCIICLHEVKIPTIQGGLHVATCT